MSNIQEGLDKKLEEAQKNFLDAISNLDKQIFDKIGSIKENYTLQTEMLEAKKGDNAELFSNQESGEIQEMEHELISLREEREEILNIVKEKEIKINDLKNKIEDFTDRIFRRTQEIENLINN